MSCTNTFACINFHFSLPTEEVKNRTSEAKKMLTTWRETYKEYRLIIESSGRDQRWEFDRKRLFERTDYMSGICQNLYDIAQVSERMFGDKTISSTIGSMHLGDWFKTLYYQHCCCCFFSY